MLSILSMKAFYRVATHYNVTVKPSAVEMPGAICSFYV